MKKTIKRVLFVILTSLVLVSCLRVDYYYHAHIIHKVWGWNGCSTHGSIVFGSYGPATKAIEGEGPNGVGYGNFKVFGFKDNTAIMDPYQVNWQDNSWIYEGIGTQELQYYDRDSEQYDFIGVISDKTPIRVDKTVTVSGVESFLTNDEMNSPKEFLYGQKTVLPSEYNDPVVFTFNHANARMFLGFASDRNDTKILDYACWTTYNLKNATNLWPRAGFSSPTISDEDIAYINSWYENNLGSWPTSSGTLSTMTTANREIPEAYKTTVLVGEDSYDFFDARKYLASKYDIIDWGNWNTDFQYGHLIVHIDKPSSTYRAWMFNPNASYNTFDVVGLEGIRVFSVDDSGTTNQHKVHTVSADAHINTTEFATFDSVVANSDVLIFDHPAGFVAQANNTNISWAGATASPTIFYSIPINNTGYVVKFSYKYNGVTYYDARVLIPTESANFEQSKDYTYVIYITDHTNGTTDIDEAINDKDEVDTNQKVIVFSEVNFASYTSGGHYVYTAQ